MEAPAYVYVLMIRQLLLHTWESVLEGLVRTYEVSRPASWKVVFCPSKGIKYSTGGVCIYGFRSNEGANVTKKGCSGV